MIRVALFVALALTCLPAPARAAGPPDPFTPAIAVITTPIKQCRKTCEVSPRGVALVKFFEGYSPVPYRDAAGHWTVGFGHLVKPGERHLLKGPIAAETAHALLVADMRVAARAMNGCIHVPVWTGQYDSTVSLTYNMGARAICASKLLKATNAHRHGEAADRFGDWVYAKDPKTGKPRKLRGLERRRFAEAEMYRRAKP